MCKEQRNWLGLAHFLITEFHPVNRKKNDRQQRAKARLPMDTCPFRRTDWPVFKDKYRKQQTE